MTVSRGRLVLQAARQSSRIFACAVVGETDPDGKDKPKDPITVGDLHATILTAVGIDPKKVAQTPIGRTARFADGEPIAALLGKRG